MKYGLTDKDLKSIIDYREISWSIWKRKFGTNRVDFFITNGNYKDIIKMLKESIPDFNDDTQFFKYMKDQVKRYIKENDIYTEDYS